MSILTRRQFAKGAGAGLLLSPFLSFLGGRPGRGGGGVARAATPANQAKRVVFFCTMGTNTSLWSPTAVSGENSFTFSDMTAPLAAVKDHIVLVEGTPAGNTGDGHGSPQGFCARDNGYYAVNNVAQQKISLDQFISDKLQAAGINRPIPVLTLGSDTANGQTMIWRGDQNLHPIASPASAYTTVFGQTMPTNAQPDKLLARRKSILDTVTAEITNIEGNIGSHEKAKLDLHLDSIRQLENKLMSSGMVSATCNMGSMPTDSTSSSPGVANDLLHLDIIVNALACDLTRVAVIQFGTDQAFQVDMPGLQGDQHTGFLHGSQTDFTHLIAFEQWLSTQFATMITNMKNRASPDDPNRSLLEDTLLMWVRDMGEAAVTHNMISMRFVLASGNAGGNYLKTNPNGRYLDLRNASNTNGANRHERVLLTACEALGITSYAGFGDPNLATKTPLPNIAA